MVTSGSWNSTAKASSSGRRAMPDLSAGSWNAFFWAAEPTDTWKCAPLPVRFENGFGMNVAIMPCLCAISLAAIFTNVKLSADLSAFA